MKPIDLLSLGVLAAALGLAGCRSLTEQSAAIQVGDTPDQVLGAMGDPDERREVAGVPGHRSVWVYATHDPARLQKTGWSEVVMPRVDDQHGTVVQQPITRDIYRTQATEEVQVNFTDGLVSSLEHRKR